MIYLVTTLHILVCFFIIIVVLLQSGKSGDISAAFGGQGSQTAFGPRGAASALSKATTWSAVAFMVTSITLSVYASRRSGPTSVLQGIKSQPVKTQPAPAPEALHAADSAEITSESYSLRSMRKFSAFTA